MMMLKEFSFIVALTFILYLMDEFDFLYQTLSFACLNSFLVFVILLYLLYRGICLSCVVNKVGLPAANYTLCFRFVSLSFL